MKPHPQGLGWRPANICKPIVWPFGANVLIFKEPQRQHLETKPHSLRHAILGWYHSTPSATGPEKAYYVVWLHLEKQFAML